MAYGACPPAEQLGAMDSRAYGEILRRLPELRADPKAGLQAPECELDPHDSYIYQCTRSCCFRRLLDMLGDEGAKDGGYSEAEMKLRMDISAGKVCWSAELWADLWDWTRNSNPVIALFRCHPLHPISQAERIFITVLHSFFILMISSATPRATECVKAGITRCLAPGAGDDPQMLGFCCLSAHIGLSWFIAHTPFLLGGAIYAAAVNTIFAQLMYQVGAGCICVQKEPRRVRRFWELLGHVFMFLVLVAMIWPTWKTMSWNARTGHLGYSIGTFFVSKPFSVMGTTAAQTLVFAGKWTWQMARNAAGRSYGEFYVTASDYQAFARARALEVAA